MTRNDAITIIDKMLKDAHEMGISPEEIIAIRILMGQERAERGEPVQMMLPFDAPIDGETEKK